jgi:GNAT superfamily N-acetyltransferase
MTSNSIRLASNSDISAIFHVRTSVVENYMSEEELAEIGITRQSISESLDNGSAGAWCAEVNGNIVGFSLTFLEDREISGLFVLPEFERQGFGTKLLNQAVNWLFESGDSPVRLPTDPDTRAFAFYQKRGWKISAYRAENEDSEGDIYLEYDRDSD